MSGPPGLSREIPGAGADADGVVAPCVGGDRGARPRPGRHCSVGAGHGHLDLHDRSRTQRTAVAHAGAAGPGIREVPNGSALVRSLRSRPLYAAREPITESF